MRFYVLLGLDLALLIMFSVLEQVPFTGLTLHEWLGLAVVAMVVAHLLLSWAWVASTTRRLMSGGSIRTRLNYALNPGLFGCVTGTILSGVLISEHAVPNLASVDHAWAWGRVHDWFSNLVIVFAMVHLAMNWDWMMAALRKAGRAR